jgi:glucan endo-1,3-alpha-glucosidase
MALSFDMTVFGCGDWSNAGTIQSYLKYTTHSAAARYKNKPIVTTFAGEGCTFGRGSANAGWAAVFGSYANSIYFMPAYNAPPTSLGGYNIQAEVNWGSAWPSAGADIEMSRDQWYMKQLNPSGKGYIGTVAPLFYAHMSYKVCRTTPCIVVVGADDSIRTHSGEVMIGYTQ